MKWIVVALTLSAMWGAPVARGGESIQWEPYQYETRDGRTISDAERGRLRVPENRSAEGGEQIELSFIRFRSTADTPGPPIIWLAGGPSDFGSDDIEGPYLELVRAFQSVGDVIALDQRGAGLSEPRLTCPDDVVELPLDAPLDLDELIDAYRTVSRRCAAHWRDAGVDLSAYNTNENADDIDDLRAALGVDRVHLYGASYGTHLGLAVIRRHGDRVARAVLSGVEGPDQTWKLPSAIETHFAEVARARGTTTPDLVTTMRAVLARLDSQPVTVAVETGENEVTEIVVGGLDLRLANRYFLGDLDNIRRLPEIYAALDAGDYSLLASVAINFRKVSAGSAMYFAMDCASGATTARLERIARESSLPLSLVGEALNVPFPGVCDAWGVPDLGDNFRGELLSDVPVLFISGTLDGQTPVGNVSELLPGFPRARHLIVENATHQYLELSMPEIAATMTQFLRGEAVEPLVLSAPELVFEEGTEEGDTSAASRR